MRIRGTQESIPFIEIGKTMFILEQMLNIEEEEFSGWEYETSYSYSRVY